MIRKCVIRAAKREDMVAVADMIRLEDKDSQFSIALGNLGKLASIFGIIVTYHQELAVFHKMPEQAELTAKVLEHDGFKRQPPAFCCKVAEIGQAVVGYTMYFPAYSSWTGRAILLEDLYVLKAHRKKGIGDQLFDAVAKEAVTTGCTRVDFHVVEWNKALTFYEGKGAVNLTKKEKWCYFRLSGDALKKFA